jgi:hypothetical protein
MSAPPAFGRDFPISHEPISHDEPSNSDLLLPDLGSSARPPGRTQLFASPPPPGPPPPLSHSVSIVMPAPDGSMMAPLSRGPASYVIVRRDKRHGPYDLAQLERLIPMGKLRSVDEIDVDGMKMLAVDLPGLRPLFEARAREEEKSVVRPLPTPPPPTPAPDTTRNKLWIVIGLLAFGLVVSAAYMALR